MSLVSAVIGQTRGDELQSDSQKFFNDIAEQLAILARKGNEMGSMLARYDSTKNRLENEKTNLIGQQYALVQNSLFGNGNNGNNLLAFSGNIKARMAEIAERLNELNFEQENLKAKQEIIPEKEKALKRKKNLASLNEKMGGEQSKKNASFIDQQVKSMFA